MIVPRIISYFRLYFCFQRVLALFLSSIGNPAPATASGHSDNGKCRPKFSVVTNILQSTANIVKIYNSSLFATAAAQGAGLVNAFQVLTATTIFSPSELSLNDTVRKASSYKVNVTNIGNTRARYKMSHDGAALTTGTTADDDQLLVKPVFSPNYANVIIEPIEFELQPGKSLEITLRFQDPPGADPTRLPIYSGFIYATNKINGEVTHMTYAGIVGDYGNAPLLVRKTASGVITGIADWGGIYVSDGEIPLLNVTEGYIIHLVLAWSTRVAFMEVVPAEGNVLVGFNVSSAIVYDDIYATKLRQYNLARNVPPTIVSGFQSAYSIVWFGKVAFLPSNGSSTNLQITNLHPGQYRIKFSALKHFQDLSMANAFDVYYSPPFNLTF